MVCQAGMRFYLCGTFQFEEHSFESSYSVSSVEEISAADATAVDRLAHWDRVLHTQERIIAVAIVSLLGCAYIAQDSALPFIVRAVVPATAGCFIFALCCLGVYRSSQARWQRQRALSESMAEYIPPPPMDQNLAVFPARRDVSIQTSADIEEGLLEFADSEVDG